MTTGILIITHNQVGEVLLNTAQSILGSIPMPVALVNVPHGECTDSVLKSAQDKYRELNTPDGVLILTDMYGSTPSNISQRLQDEYPATVLVSGINLPMLIRVLNYPTLDLHQLAHKAVTGGRDGIVLSEPRD
jgi:PTS system ascorbate-specific IIA component